MKRPFLFILFIVSYSNNEIFAQSFNQTDRQDWGVTNNVATVHQTFYSVVHEKDQIKKGKKISDKFEIESKVTFDNNGNKIEDIRYDMSGNPKSKITYSYDDKNNCTLERRSDMDGKLLRESKFSYKYGPNEKLIEVDGISDDGITKKVIYKYNASGNIVSKEWFLKEGTPDIKIEFVCDTKGNIINQTDYDSKGNVEWKYVNTYNASGKIIEENTFKKGTKFYGKYTYAYNEKENKSEMHWYDKNPDKPYMNWTYTYEYDSNGNWIKQIQYNGKKAISFTEREIGYNL